MMALSAAKSDLTLSLVGEDETAQMLADANDRVSALEGKLKSLKAAGDQQAASARAQGSALNNANKSMATFSKSAEGMVEGLDKAKGAFGKITGALGFWGAAITGAVALGSELINMLSATSGEIAKLEGELATSKKSADEFATSMREMSNAITAAQISSNNLATSTAGLRSRLATLRGDLVGAEFERRQAEQLAIAGQILDVETKMAESRAAQTKAMEQAAKAQEQVEKGAAVEAKLRAELQKAEMDRKLGLKTQDGEILHLKSLQLQRTIDENKQNRNLLAGAERRTKELETQVDSLAEQKNLMRDIIGLMQGQKFEVPGATDPVTPPKPRGGGSGPAKETDRERRERELQQQKEDMQRQIRMNREFTAQVMENIDLRIKREQEELRFMEEVAEKAAKFRAAKEQWARDDIALPVIDFASALTSNLVPALSEVEAAMSKVSAIFEDFRNGQKSLTEALGAGATEIAAFAAKAIGGVKAEAAVRAAYELAMGFATLATPAISAGHFTAAAMLGAVAVGLIPTGASASGPKNGKKAPGKKGDSGPSEAPASTVVYNISAGVMDGQSVNHAIRQSERSSRGTGYSRAAGV
jgi:hypothetical protein